MTTVLENLKRQYERSPAEHGANAPSTKTLKAQIDAAKAPGNTAADLYASRPLKM